MIVIKNIKMQFLEEEEKYKGKKQEEKKLPQKISWHAYCYSF